MKKAALYQLIDLKDYQSDGYKTFYDRRINLNLERYSELVSEPGNTLFSSKVFSENEMPFIENDLFKGVSVKLEKDVTNQNLLIIEFDINTESVLFKRNILLDIHTLFFNAETKKDHSMIFTAGIDKKTETNIRYISKICAEEAIDLFANLSTICFKFDLKEGI